MIPDEKNVHKDNNFKKVFIVILVNVCNWKQMTVL